MLEDHRYDRIVDDIQSHNSNYRLPKYPNRADADVEEYIGLFEDVGYFIVENLIAAKMAYDHFSYDIEKAWCNVSVRETIEQERATDRSKTAHSDPLYGNFEKLAKEYLDNEGQTCKDLDSSPAVCTSAEDEKTTIASRRNQVRMSGNLKGFGCRPEHERSIRYKAGVRKPRKKEPAGKR